MRKLLLSAFLIAIVISGLHFVGDVPFGKAQTSTSVSGIISSDTTWTKSESPYSLIGPIAVQNGVTLTIEPGVVVYLGGYYLLINGSLNADQIDVQPDLDLSANITFASTSTGSIINSNVGTVYINSASPEISGSQIYSLIIDGGSSIISGNDILQGRGLQVQNGTPTILNNTIDVSSISGGSPIIFGNTFPPVTTISMGIHGGSPVFLNNTINAETDIDGGSPLISNNTINGQVVIGYGLYSGSTAYPRDGIGITGGTNISIDNNVITGVFGDGLSISGGTMTIQKNLIYSVENGVTINGGSPIIQNNTIFGCSDGISTTTTQLTLVYNNLQNNSYNLNLDTASNLNATYNWWGTTDTQAINQTIYDSNYNFNLGTVTFVPFLTEPNPQASPTTTSIPTLTPTSRPTQSSSPSQTPTPTPTSTPTTSVASSSSSSTLPSQAGANTTSLLMELMVTGIVVMVIVAVAVVAFLLGKKTGRKTGGIL